MLEELWRNFILWSPEDKGGGNGNGNGNGTDDPDEDKDSDSDDDDDKDEDGDSEDDDNGDEEKYDKPRALKTIRKLRRIESEQKKKLKDQDTRLKKLETEDKKRKDAELSDIEKATKAEAELKTENESLKSDLQIERIRNRVVIEASRLDFADPDDAYSLMDQDEIEHDDESGEISGVKDALKALAKDKPYLLKSDSDEDDDDKNPDGTPKRKKSKKVTKKSKKKADLTPEEKVKTRPLTL